MQFVQVKYPEVSLLKQFLEGAGSSLRSFRYFQKRPLEVIKEHLCTFLLLDGAKPVAYGHLDVSDEATVAVHCAADGQGHKTGNTIWLGIAVADAYRGKGLGLMMMNQLITFARQHGVRQIRLSVDNDNVAAISLYKKLGFVLHEQKESFGFYTLTLSKC